MSCVETGQYWVMFSIETHSRNCVPSSVERFVDVEACTIVGKATFGHHVSIVALVPVATNVHLMPPEPVPGNRPEVSIYM